MVSHRTLAYLSPTHHVGFQLQPSTIPTSSPRQEPGRSERYGFRTHLFMCCLDLQDLTTHDFIVWTGCGTESACPVGKVRGGILCCTLEGASLMTVSCFQWDGRPPHQSTAIRSISQSIQHGHAPREGTRECQLWWQKYVSFQKLFYAHPDPRILTLVIMPPSSLAHLTSLDLQSPWKFKLRNPGNSAASTHAGVLEFIAQEGVVHLPYWMMKTLRLEEGDPIRITGTELPKGKMVKLQAQSVHFLEVSDPKAV